MNIQVMMQVEKKRKCNRFPVLGKKVENYLT